MKTNSAKKFSLMSPKEKKTVINVRERIKELKEEKIKLLAHSLTNSLTIEGVITISVGSVITTLSMVTHKLLSVTETK